MDDFLDAHKRKKVLELLDRGLVMLHLDPRREGVVVPPAYASDAVLRLNIAYGFNLPALEVGEEGIYAVLSFNRRNFGCNIPWPALFAASMPNEGHEGVVWPSSLPPELDETVLRAVMPLAGRDDLDDDDDDEPRDIAGPPTDPTEPIGPGRPGRPGFTVIEGGESEPGEPGAPRKPPVLKVIKS